MKIATPLTLHCTLLATLTALSLAIDTHALSTDTIPPSLVSMAFQPASVDVTSSAQPVTITINISDNLSGFTDPLQGTIGFTTPSGAYQYADLYTFHRISQDISSETWQGTFTVQQKAAAGTWHVGYFSLSDRAGNWLYLQGSGSLPALEVISPTDLTPPNLLGLTLSSPTIDTSNGYAYELITLHVADLLSGFGPSTTPSFCDYTMNGVVAVAPNGLVSWGANCFSRTGGDANDGTWQVYLFFPQYSPAGQWSIYVRLKDNAGNTLFLPSTALQNLGFPGGFEVFSVPSDTLPPTVSQISLSPITIDTSSSDQTVNGTISVSDDLSGMQWAGAWFRSPSGAQQRGVFFQSPGADRGQQLLSGSCIFPRYSEAGTWTLSEIDLMDRAGNHQYLYGPALAALDLTANVNVILPSLSTDGTVDSGGGTVVDRVFDRAELIVPPNLLQANTTVAIDVLQSELDVPIPTGFKIDPLSYYVNIHLDPTPQFPLPSPGLTVVLPLRQASQPGITLNLLRIDPATGDPVPAIGVAGLPVQGTVDPSGLSVTFTGVARLSTVVAVLRDAVIQTFTASATPNVLWPPNHKMIPVVINTAVTDTQNSPITLSVDQITSTEPQTKDKLGKTIPDWQIVNINQQTDQISLQLRAERAGTAVDRVYTISLTASNPYGSSKSTAVQVTVPHDQRQP